MLSMDDWNDRWVLDLLEQMSGYLYNRVKNDMVSRQSTEQHDVAYRLYSSRTAKLIYVLLGLTITLRRMWIMYAAMLVMYAQISWIVLKWFVYTIDDPELQKSIQFMKGWLQLILTEGASILQNRDAAKFMMAGAMLKTMPTGISYVRASLRYRTRQMNLQVLEVFDEDLN